MGCCFAYILTKFILFYLTRAYLPVRITGLLVYICLSFANTFLHAFVYMHMNTHTVCFLIPECLKLPWDSYF